MKKIIWIAFLAAGLGELVSILANLEILHRVCKPLITVTLAIAYGLTVKREGFSMAVFLALVFSFLGDTLLMFESRNSMYFMPGLAAFLVAHIFYILAYRQHRTDESEAQLYGVQKVRLAFPVILAGTGLIVILYPTLGALKIPVMLYALVLTVMVLNALFRYGRTPAKSFWLVFGGALLFMFSDALLAINKFLSPISNAHFWIMLTYIGAQLFLVRGLIAHSKFQG